MPIFMDRHDIKGVTAEDVAKVHQKDLEIQHLYNCRGLTYWFDEERGTAFCLVEAPDRQSLKAMHDDAHGMVPHQIIEVDDSLVEAFLGRIEDPEPAEDIADLGIHAFEDPAFRSIMIIELKDAALIPTETGLTKAREIFRELNNTIRDSIERHGGRVVNHTYHKFTAVFASISNSVECSVNIQERVMSLNHPFSGVTVHPGIGINAGEPVTESDQFFGETVLFAERLSYIAGQGQIRVSSDVSEHYKKENLKDLSEKRFLDTLNSQEENFLGRLMDATEEIWNKDGFNVQNYCSLMGESKSQLYRNLKRLTGRSATEFMKEFRLKQALNTMKEKPDNISQIAYETGFNNPSYFSKCFKERYGLLPSEFIESVD